MKYACSLCFMVLVFFAHAQKIQPLAVRSAELYNKTIVQIKPVYKNYVAQTAKAFSSRKLNLDSLKNTMKTPGNTMFSSLSDADVTTLIFLIMQAAAADNEADLKDQMAEMQKNLQKKEALRDEEQRIKDAAKPGAYPRLNNTLANMDKSRQPKEAPGKAADSVKLKMPIYTAEQLKRLAAIKQEKDSLDEMSQQDQLKLQQMMDKKNQLEQMISNVMKAAAETQNGLSSNLKAS